jgi:hypothetical protein
MQPLPFRYWPSGWQQQSIRLFTKRGEVGTESVLLDRREILLASIVATASDGRELLISVMTPYGRDDVQIAVAPGRSSGLVFRSGTTNASRVKEAIDSACSRARFEQRRQEVAEVAPTSAKELRSETCPHCLALVDVSGFPRSPQVFCPYCGTIGTMLVPTPEEKRLRICDGCHYFGFPEPFTSHRVANLLIRVLIEKETRTLCGACMRTEAWVNLRGNLISVIGIPISAIELLQAHSFGSRRHKRFAELDSANDAATNEKTDRAEVLYERLLNRVGVSAPLHYNRAKERYDSEDWSGALDEARAALEDCSNFVLPLTLACRSLVRLGRREEAQALAVRYQLEFAC